MPKSTSTRSKCKMDVWRQDTERRARPGDHTKPSGQRPTPRNTSQDKDWHTREKISTNDVFLGGQGSTITCQGLVDSKYQGGIGRTPSSIYPGMLRLPHWRDKVQRHRFAAALRILIYHCSALCERAFLVVICGKLFIIKNLPTTHTQRLNFFHAKFQLA
jgi:hypothetical protein